MSVNIGTAIGMPLSTTHCMVGALFGLLVAGKFSVVNEAYEGHEDEPESDTNRELQQIETV